MALSEKMKQRAAANAYMNHSHIKLAEAGEDRGVTELVVGEENLNPYGLAHGGVLYTMADCAAGAAAHEDGRTYVTQDSSLYFLQSAKKGETVRAEGRVRRRGRTTCYVEVEISNGEGELLCRGSFSYFCIGG